MEFRPHVTVAAILERDGKLLLIEEQSHGRLVLNNPAGHIEHNENLFDAVVRETEEESGWLMRPTALVGVYQWRSPDSDNHYVRFTFAGDLVEQLHPGPTDPTIERALWMPARDLLQLDSDRLRSPVVKRGVRDWLKGERTALTTIGDLLNA